MTTSTTRPTPAATVRSLAPERFEANPARGRFNAAFFWALGGYINWHMGKRKAKAFAHLPPNIVEHGIVTDRDPRLGRVMVVLRSGSVVQVRQIRGTDAPLLADGFDRLSAESRRLRFLTPKTKLSQEELRYLTDVDHHDHEAIVALGRDGRGVGVARFVRDAEDPQAAEIAVTIVDDWQGRGLGTELLAALTVRAHEEGILRFTAIVAVENLAMTALLHRLHANVELVRREFGTLEYLITLAPRSRRSVHEPSLNLQLAADPADRLGPQPDQRVAAVGQQPQRLRALVEWTSSSSPCSDASATD